MKNGLLATAILAVSLSTACGGQEAAIRAAVHPRAGDDIPAHEPRFDRDRPVVALIVPEGGAEVTDFVVPYGILANSGVAEVVAVSMESGAIDMFPALTIEAETTTSDFDAEYPRGADYVIVPATHDPGDAALTGWIRGQAASGAILVGVCDGVLVLSEAGLLEGRRATAHWYSFGKLQRKHRNTAWVRDRRYVADGNIITTTGVSASVPVSLALVEAIAGEERAREVARSYSVDEWSATHESGAYGLSAGHVLGFIGDFAAFWREESIGLEIGEGVDEVTLALVADAWSRTGRSSLATIAPGEGPIRTRGGLLLHPDRSTGGDHPDRMLEPLDGLAAGAALDHALGRIEALYGQRRAGFVALQLEHPRSGDAGGEQ